MGEKTGKYSITIPQDIATEARRRAEGSGLSAYITQAVKWRIEQENLDELIEAAVAQHGPVDPHSVEEKAAILRGDAPTQSSHAA